MEICDEIIEKKVENLKNSDYYLQLEREINLMFFKIISSVVSENQRLKGQNERLKKAVKITAKERGYEKIS